MMPLLMTTSMSSWFRPTGRVGPWGTWLVIAVAPATGPTLAGLLQHVGTWRHIFVFTLPIAVSILLLGLLRLHNAGLRSPTPLDVSSIPLSMLAP